MNIKRILLGTFVVGTLDILYAMAFWWLRNRVSPGRIFQSVAAGLLGREAAVAGGTGTVLLGALLHYFIAFMIVLVYALASRRIALLRRRPILCGAIYGIGVWVVMNYIVVPLSKAGRGSTLVVWIVLSIVVHAFLIGIPAAWFGGRERGALVTP